MKYICSSTSVFIQLAILHSFVPTDLEQFFCTSNLNHWIKAFLKWPSLTIDYIWIHIDIFWWFLRFLNRLFFSPVHHSRKIIGAINIKSGSVKWASKHKTKTLKPNGKWKSASVNFIFMYFFAPVIFLLWHILSFLLNEDFKPKCVHL